MPDNKAIKIHFSQGDLEDLLNGESFEWTFPVIGKDNEWIDVELVMGDEEEDEEQ